jgi:hypothetical protein
LMKLVGSNGNSSLILMLQMMVRRFVSGTHKVMMVLILVVFVLVWLKLP